MLNAKKRKRCGRVVRLTGETKIYCGRGKKDSNGDSIREWCSDCRAFNNGFDVGYSQKIKENKPCQVLTCANPSLYVISEGCYLVRVCANHARGKEGGRMKIEKVGRRKNG